MFDESAPTVRKHFGEGLDCNQQQGIADLKLSILICGELLYAKRSFDVPEWSRAFVLVAESASNVCEAASAPCITWRTTKNANNAAHCNQVEIMPDIV